MVADGGHPPLASWNYRLVLTDGGRYEVREVWYDEEGRVVGWSASAVGVTGEDPADARNEYRHIGEAFALPLLVERNLPGGVEGCQDFVEVRDSGG